MTELFLKPLVLPDMFSVSIDNYNDNHPIHKVDNQLIYNVIFSMMNVPKGDSNAEVNQYLDLQNHAIYLSTLISHEILVKNNLIPGYKIKYIPGPDTKLSDIKFIINKAH